MDANPAILEPLGEMLSRHDCDPRRDAGRPRRERLQERQPAQKAVEPGAFFTNQLQRCEYGGAILQGRQRPRDPRWFGRGLCLLEQVSHSR